MSQNKSLKISKYLLAHKIELCDFDSSKQIETGIVPIENWLVKHPIISGVFFNECYYKLPFNDFSNAHVHNSGWICFKTIDSFYCQKIWLHELAHLINQKLFNDYNGHNNNWRRILLKIGGTLNPIYVNGKSVSKEHYPWSDLVLSFLYKKFMDNYWCCGIDDNKDSKQNRKDSKDSKKNLEIFNKLKPFLRS